VASTRGNAQHAVAAPVQIRISALTLALVALVVALAVTLAIALASSGGGGGSDAEPVRVVPSAQNVPTPAERIHPGLNGPGMRP
jgi:hypothetical protein